MRRWEKGGFRMGTRSGRWMRVAGAGLPAVLCVLAVLAGARSAGAGEPWTGPRILEEVLRRQRLFPFVYEEQTLILKDRTGNRDVRKVRRYSRVEADGTAKFLLVFDTPAEVRGVALLKVDPPSGRGECSIYLPALGKGLVSQAGKTCGGPVLGTDFTIGDLTAEAPADFRYERVADQRIDLFPSFVVDAVPRSEETALATGYGLRRHFIRQDSFRIVRIDYYDLRKRFFKRQTFHDPARVQGGLWQANMTLMENHKAKHETLIKTDLRVISGDYASPEMFTPAWLLENRHIQGKEKRLFQKDAPIPGEPEEASPEGPLSRVRQGRQAGSPGENP
ncbi:MAG: outer membrane lipoprotein-sorting protein [Thermodesulfobacteriota bacterium]